MCCKFTSYKNLQNVGFFLIFIINFCYFKVYQNIYINFSVMSKFLRVPYLAGDSIGDIEVLTQSLHSAEVEFNESYKCIVMLQPTSPLRKKIHISDSINAVIKDSWDASFTANKVDLKYHPLKSLKISSNGSSDYYLCEGSKIISRQMLIPTYIRNGACYSITPLCLTTIKSFIGKHSKLRAAGTGVKQSLFDVDTYEGENIFALTDCLLTCFYTG